MWRKCRVDLSRLEELVYAIMFGWPLIISLLPLMGILSSTWWNSLPLQCFPFWFFPWVPPGPSCLASWASSPPRDQADPEAGNLHCNDLPPALQAQVSKSQEHGPWRVPPRHQAASWNNPWASRPWGSSKVPWLQFKTVPLKQMNFREKKYNKDVLNECVSNAQWMVHGLARSSTKILIKWEYSGGKKHRRVC